MVATSAGALPSAASPVISFSLKATRATPRGREVPWVQDANRPSAEAPRPAHDRIDGRSPGSRVTARHRLPGLPQWLCGSGSPLTVAGAAAESELWEPGSPFHTAFPVRSQVRDRRSGSLNGPRRHLVNAIVVPGRATRSCRGFDLVRSNQEISRNFPGFADLVNHVDREGAPTRQNPRRTRARPGEP